MQITYEWLMTQQFDVVGNGREIRLNCPNCDDTSKHLYVNKSRLVWHCFKCAKGGKVVYQNQEPDLSMFENKTSIYASGEVELQKKVYNEITKIRTLPMHRSLPYIEIAEDCESGEELTARNYLHSRGVIQAEIIKYNICLSLERTGPYRNSIIFPVYDTHNVDVDYFVCRKYDKSKPKYVNAPWPKGDTLFIADGIEHSIEASPILCEGIFDALAIARLGYTAIALLGKSITSQQLGRLSNIDDRYIIYLDNDALSHAVQLKLQLNALDIRTKLIRQDKDAADLYLEDPKYLRGAIENARKH